MFGLLGHICCYSSSRCDVFLLFELLPLVSLVFFAFPNRSVPQDWAPASWRTRRQRAPPQIFGPPLLPGDRIRTAAELRVVFGATCPFPASTDKRGQRRGRNHHRQQQQQRSRARGWPRGWRRSTWMAAGSAPQQEGMRVVFGGDAAAEIHRQSQRRGWRRDTSEAASWTPRRLGIRVVFGGAAVARTH